MNHRRTMLALLGAGVSSLLVPAAALASPHHGHGHKHGHGHVEVVVKAPAKSFVQVDNRFDGPAQVWIDGRLAGQVPGNARATFETHPGMHTVVMKRAATGFVLRSDRLLLSKNVTTLVKVQAPKATLLVTNPSRTLLKVDTGRQEAWISPGTAVQLTVDAGNVQLIATARGEQRVHDRTVWVEPGKLATTTLDYVEPTRFLVINQHPHHIRVVVDGREAARVEAGARVWIDTRAGVRNVQMFYGSRLIQTETLRFERGQQLNVTSGDSNRPGPPPRLTSSTSSTTAICPATGRPITIASR